MAMAPATYRLEWRAWQHDHHATYPTLEAALAKVRELCAPDKDYPLISTGLPMSLSAPNGRVVTKDILCDYGMSFVFTPRATDPDEEQIATLLGIPTPSAASPGSQEGTR